MAYNFHGITIEKIALALSIPFLLWTIIIFDKCNKSDTLNKVCTKSNEIQLYVSFCIAALCWIFATCWSHFKNTNNEEERKELIMEV